MQKHRLFTPGPVEVPPSIRAAMARPLIHHRTPEFMALYARTCERLAPIFGTTRPVHVLAASGTGGLEAVLINQVGETDQVLTVEAGKFGARWHELCEAFGIRHQRYEVEWGRAPDAAELDRQLAALPEARVVCLTHSETSTGVLADLEALARVSKARGCRVLVDCVTSACAHTVRMDAWGLDCVVSGSQKGFMLPPGLAMVALSEAAEAALEDAATGRYYFDLRRVVRSAAKRSTPFTPAVSLVVGLAAALDLIEDEGLEQVIARHAQLAAAARDAVSAMGLELFAQPPSNIVTVARVPDSVDGDRVRGDLESRFGVKIAGGQEHLKGRIWRLGHLGYYDATDLFGALGAFERVLCDHGHAAVPGGAVAAASSHFESSPVAPAGR